MSWLSIMLSVRSASRFFSNVGASIAADHPVPYNAPANAPKVADEDYRTGDVPSFLPSRHTPELMYNRIDVEWFNPASG